MSKASISTIAGNWDSEKIARLRATLVEAEDQQGMSRDQVVKFDGQDVLISFGWYLVEYVELELAKRGTGGL